MADVAYNLDYEERYEIIEGDKIIMSPTANAGHSTIISRLIAIFTNYVDEHNCGAVFADNMDVNFPDGSLFRPDLSVVCNPKVFNFNSTIYGVPDLVVEVLSRSTMKKDVTIKKNIYEKNGVREYWIINPLGKTIEVYHLVDGSYVLDDIYQAYSKDDLSLLTEAERAEIKYEIKVSIFEDLVVDVRKVFRWWFGQIVE